MTTKEEILALAKECGCTMPLRSGFGDCRVPQFFGVDHLISFYHAARKPLKEQLELYAAENSSLREAGFENAQDLFTSYQGLEQQLAAAKQVRDGCTLVKTDELKSMQQQLADMYAHYQAALEAEQVRYRQLAAAQLQITQYRMLLECALSVIDEGEHTFTANMIANALAQPTDTTALEAMIAKAGEVMRERCADTAEDYNGKRGEHDGSAIAHIIRALPGVTLEDLK